MIETTREAIARVSEPEPIGDPAYDSELAFQLETARDILAADYAIECKSEALDPDTGELLGDGTPTCGRILPRAKHAAAHMVKTVMRDGHTVKTSHEVDGHSRMDAAAQSDLIERSTRKAYARAESEALAFLTRHDAIERARAK